MILSMCTSGFLRSFLINSILVFYSLGFLVMSYSLHLSNYLRSPVLEAPVIGSNFLESFSILVLCLRTY